MGYDITMHSRKAFVPRIIPSALLQWARQSNTKQKAEETEAWTENLKETASPTSEKGFAECRRLQPSTSQCKLPPFFSTSRPRLKFSWVSTSIPGFAKFENFQGRPSTAELDDRTGAALKSQNERHLLAQTLDAAQENCFTQSGNFYSTVWLLLNLTHFSPAVSLCAFLFAKEKNLDLSSGHCMHWCS